MVIGILFKRLVVNRLNRFEDYKEKGCLKWEYF